LSRLEVVFLDGLKEKGLQTRVLFLMVIIL